MPASSNERWYQRRWAIWGANIAAIGLLALFSPIELTVGVLLGWLLFSPDAEGRSLLPFQRRSRSVPVVHVDFNNVGAHGWVTASSQRVPAPVRAIGTEVLLRDRMERLEMLGVVRRVHPHAVLFEVTGRA